MAGYCRVCGDEQDTRYYSTKRQTLCRSCAKDTPSKVSRQGFKRVYFDGDPVDDWTVGTFYEDYLRSNFNLTDYRRETTSFV